MFQLLSFFVHDRKAFSVAIVYGVLLIPYFLKRIKEKRRFGKKTQWHEYLLSLRIPVKWIARIESSFYRNPHHHESAISCFLMGKRGEVFVDVGANLGRYVILLGKFYRRIIAIEPESSNVAFLKRNIEEASLKNVVVRQCAVLDSNCTVALRKGNHAGGHSIDKNIGNGEIKVKGVTLEELIKDLDKVDLVKVDVEGAEWLVLKGAMPVLSKINSWVVELHERSKERELENLFLTHGYKIEWLDSGVEYRHIYAWRS